MERYQPSSLGNTQNPVIATEVKSNLTQSARTWEGHIMGRKQVFYIYSECKQMTYVISIR